MVHPESSLKVSKQMRCRRKKMGPSLAPGKMLTFRIEQGWTLREMGQLTGISPATLCRLERGLVRLTPSSMVKLQNALKFNEFQICYKLDGYGRYQVALKHPVQTILGNPAKKQIL